MIKRYPIIFIGGAIGALCRYWLSLMNQGVSFPIGTFVANLLGAFLMGALAQIASTHFKQYPNLKKGLTTGLLGALTTFSTFQFECLTMLQHHAYVLLLSYAMATYILGVALCYAGVKLGG